MCLPFEPGSSMFVIPRRDTRTKMAHNGFIGKISFSSDWSEDQMKDEIAAILRKSFGVSENQSFPFEYLTIIKGSMKLMKPNVTSNFRWGGTEVTSVCSNTCLYIMAGVHAPAQVCRAA